MNLFLLCIVVSVVYLTIHTEPYASQQSVPVWTTSHNGFKVYMISDYNFVPWFYTYFFTQMIFFCVFSLKFPLSRFTSHQRNWVKRLLFSFAKLQFLNDKIDQKTIFQVSNSFLMHLVLQNCKVNVCLSFFSEI